MGGAGGLIADNTITASDIDIDAVDSSEIKSEAVGTSEIENGAIMNEDISNSTIQPEKIAPGTDQYVLTTVGTAVQWAPLTGNTSKSGTISSTIQSIRRESSGTVTLTDSDYTVILDAGVSQVNLPAASAGNQGRIYVIKDFSVRGTLLNRAYRDMANNAVQTTRGREVIWLQSDGTEWQLIR